MCCMTRKNLAKRFDVSVTTIGCWLQKFGLSYRANRLSALPSRFNDEQENLLIASMLGDGLITKTKCRFRMKMKIGAKEYIEFLGASMSPWCRPATEVKKKAIYRQGNKILNHPSKINVQCQLYSVGHPLFKEMRKQWYPDGVKKIPQELTLNGQIIAHWFFQDGSTNPSARNAYLWTLGFQKEEVNLLKDKLLEFGIVGSVHLNRGKPYIQIHSAGFNILMSILQENIHFDCMRYKIRMTPEKAHAHMEKNLKKPKKKGKE